MGAAKPVQEVDPEAVLTKAAIRAADLLDLHGAELARVIGVSDSTISRYRSGAAAIAPTTKAGELALLLVRLFRSLDAITGGDETVARAWMSAENSALRARPVDRIVSISGLVDVLAYLDARRALV